MTTSLRDRRGRIRDDAVARFGLAGLGIDRRTPVHVEACLDVVMRELEGATPRLAGRWAHGLRDQFETMQIRELAHATCMAIGAEVAHNFRASFRDVMAQLRRIENEIATALREPVLGPLAKAA